MPKKKTMSDIRVLEKEKNITCLSEKYINVRTKMLWKCNVCEYEWLSVYTSIRRCSGCPECNSIKNTLDDAQRLAISKGGECKSIEYINAHTKMYWKCNKCMYEWMASYHSVRRVSWCPQCPDKVKNTLDDAQRLAISRDGVCKSTEYVRAHDKLHWQCDKCRHEWMATYTNVQKGHWCPNCSAGKAQRKLVDILQGLYPREEVCSGYRGFDWLYNKKTKGKQEIDIWIPHLKLAIEYDGIQHFRPTRFGGMSTERAEENFKYTVKSDRRKDRVIKENKSDVDCFIRFKYDEPLTEEYVRTRIGFYYSVHF